MRPKYIYTIPTVQNPTGTIMREARRHELLRLAAAHGVPIFEDDCYADLIWDGQRPPALYAMSKHGGVIHIGSFSKSIAPALRVGYIVAPWDVLSRMLALKTDAGSGALEQMVLGEFCAPHFDDARAGADARPAGQARNADGGAQRAVRHRGRVRRSEGRHLSLGQTAGRGRHAKLYQPALAAGVAINPGAEWSTDKGYGKSRMRLCFASPSHEEIRAGVATLAEVCRREFGVPDRIANVAAGARLTPSISRGRRANGSGPKGPAD